MPFRQKDSVNDMETKIEWRIWTYKYRKALFMGLLGSNRAGKSTTQKMVCGLAPPSQGEIWIFGKPEDDPEARKKIGILIEQPGIYPGMSAFEKVILQGFNVGLKNPGGNALEALETVGLSKHRKVCHS